MIGDTAFYVSIWIVAIPLLLMVTSFFLWRLFVNGEKNRGFVASSSSSETCVQCGYPMQFRHRCDNCGQYFREF